MVDKDKNTEVGEDNLSITNDVQYNEKVHTLSRLKEKSALRETAKPHEEAATKAEVDNVSKDFIRATNEMRIRHGSFPVDSYSDNFTHEQRFAYRKLYAEIQAKRQRIRDGATDEPRHIESLKEFTDAFGLELPDVPKKSQQKSTPIDSKGNVLKSEGPSSKERSSVDEAQDGEHEDDEA